MGTTPPEVVTDFREVEVVGFGEVVEVSPSGSGSTESRTRRRGNLLLAHGIETGSGFLTRSIPHSLESRYLGEAILGEGLPVDTAWLRLGRLYLDDPFGRNHEIERDVV